MNELLMKYKEISEKIENEKNRELDRLISSLAGIILSEENGNIEGKQEIIKEQDSTNMTFKHKVAMLSLCCLRVSLSYSLMKNGNIQYEKQIKSDMSEIVEAVKWLECSFEINDEIVSDIIDLLQAMDEVPEETLLGYIAYDFKNKKKKFTKELVCLFNNVSEYFFFEKQEDVSSCFINKLLRVSRRRNSLTQHREVIIDILARWADLLPELGYSICQLEASNFFPANDIYCSDFLWFYGCVMEKLCDIENAKSLFYKCYILRKKIYGEKDWYTIIANREYNFWLWITEKENEAYRQLIKFVDEVEHNTYTGVSEDLVKIVEGKTLYSILIGMSDSENFADYDYYLRLYEKICNKYNDTTEPLIKNRLSNNLRGGYYLKTGNYILAEKAFLDALSTEYPNNIDEIISEAQIKSNLLMIYYVENDLRQFIPLLSELLDILEEDSEYIQLSQKDEYRIYTLMVSAEAQAMIEINEEEISELKELLYNACIEISENLDAVGECAREIAIFMLCTIPLLLHNDCLSEENQKMYREALYLIENNNEVFGLYKNQQTLLFYVSVLLSWNLEETNVEEYIEKSIVASANRNVPIPTRVSILQTAATYYGKCNKYDVGKKYLDKALKELTSLWRSFVRYLNDTRLLQILAPTQLLFAGCYAVIRANESIEVSYERVLQYKALASLAGKERNRILYTEHANNELLSKIQKLQNKLALRETENIFRDANKEYDDDEIELRRLEAEISKMIPQNIDFNDIRLEKVMQMIPDNSVVIEYFVCAMEYGKKLKVSNLREENETGIDIYIIRKKNGNCKLNKETVFNASGIQKMAQEFVEILQAKSNNSVSIEQMTKMEDLRNSLYQYLVQPILSYIEDIELMYIAPDNILINLPFGILCDEDGNFLEDNHSIIEIESARDFLWNNETDTANQDTLIIGNPEYYVREIESANLNYTDRSRSFDIELGNVSQLPFTELEIRQVGARTGNAYFNGKDASKKRFLMANGYKNIHIATHGYFDLKDETESIYSSSLMFAGVNNWLQTGKINEIYGNGIVTADEVSRMDLYSTELVVLSSCLSGMSEIFDNKGFHGMVSALSAAGVRYVISHLWDADDFSTAIFMDAFYYQYIEKKQSPPVALSKAKQYLRSVTIGHLKKQGWFAYMKEMELNPEAKGLLETFEKCSDKVRPFKSEEYWGGFVCYHCN